jgi:Mg-chelatase subunit ChlD
VFIFISWMAAPGQTQQPPCLRRSVPVHVLDAKGQPVRALEASSFQAEFRGQPVRIVSSTPDEGPRRIVIVLDASGSMWGAKGNKWAMTLWIAHHLAISSPSGVSLALLVFNDKTQLSVSFSEGKAGVLEHLRQLEQTTNPKTVHGGTALRQAVMDAFHMLESPRLGDVVFVITDGDDNKSRISDRELERTVIAAGVRLYAVVLVNQAEHTPEEIGGRYQFAGIVEQTGGDTFTLLSSGPSAVVAETYYRDNKGLSDLGKSLLGWYPQLTEFYRLEIELPTPVDKLRPWKLEVKTDSKDAKKPRQVIYPRLLVPCP